MKVRVLPEPELEFRAGNRHIDPRFGVAIHGPADADSASAPRHITVGLVGSPSGIEGIRRWLDRCREHIAGKEPHFGQENMWPDFPGFSEDLGYRSEIVFDDSLTREISDRDLRLLARPDTKGAVADAAELYLNEARSLAETGRCHLIICARPDQLDDDIKEDPGPADDDEAIAEDESSDDLGEDFHDLLKAKALTLACPLQLIRRETWEGKVPKERKRPRPLQDEATRAWNLHTAAYYKAGGTPWRLPKRSTDLTTCYVGISFYKTPDGSALHTAVAEVFNERGDGVVVRGGAAKISKSDRQPHVNADGAEQLLLDALSEYRRVHRTMPARMVLHKTSAFNPAETEGFQAAADEKGLDSLELLWVRRRGAPHLFRTGERPPLRGTTLQLEPGAMVVYTNGTVEFFRAYPGMYIPQPLLLQVESKGIDLIAAATEALALSKMNWNNAQLGERDPLTIRTAGRVGSILKHVPADAKVIATRYAYYM